MTIFVWSELALRPLKRQLHRLCYSIRFGQKETIGHLVSIRNVDVILSKASFLLEFRRDIFS